MSNLETICNKLLKYNGKISNAEGNTEKILAYTEKIASYVEMLRNNNMNGGAVSANSSAFVSQSVAAPVASVTKTQTGGTHAEEKPDRVCVVKETCFEVHVMPGDKPESVKQGSVKPESIKKESVKPESVKQESVKPEMEEYSRVASAKQASAKPEMEEYSRVASAKQESSKPEEQGLKKQSGGAMNFINQFVKSTYVDSEIVRY